MPSIETQHRVLLKLFDLISRGRYKEAEALLSICDKIREAERKAQKAQIQQKYKAN